MLIELSLSYEGCLFISRHFFFIRVHKIPYILNISMWIEEWVPPNMGVKINYVKKYYLVYREKNSFLMEMDKRIYIKRLRKTIRTYTLF